MARLIENARAAGGVVAEAARRRARAMRGEEVAEIKPAMCGGFHIAQKISGVRSAETETAPSQQAERQRASGIAVAGGVKYQHARAMRARGVTMRKLYAASW